MSRPSIIALKLVQVVAMVLLVGISAATFLAGLLFKCLECLLEVFHDCVNLPIEEKLESQGGVK